jgi:hypothetical protein
MSAEELLDHLYEHNMPFRLYAEHQYGLTVEELACLSNKPISWIEEQIEAMRLCLEKQVRFEFLTGLLNSAETV